MRYDAVEEACVDAAVRFGVGHEFHAEEHPVKHSSTRRLGTVLRGRADDLDARRVEEERGHPRAMERGLDRSDRRGQRFGDFLESEVEHVLQDDRSLLLGRQLTEQRARRLSCAPRIGYLARVSDVLPDEGFLASLAAHPIDPEIGRDTKQPCSLVRWRGAHLSERGEGTDEGVLCEVLGVPWASREVATVTVEIESQRLENFEEATP